MVIFKIELKLHPNKLDFIRKNVAFYSAILLFISCFTISAQSDLPERIIKKYTQAEGLSNNTVKAIIQDNLGYTWVGTKDGLNRFDGNNFKIFRHDASDKNSLLDNCVNALAIDKDGCIYIGTNNGLSQYNPIEENFLNYQNNPANIHSLSNNQVNAIYVDKPGNLWVGTNGGGLNFLEKKTNIFIRYIVNPKKSNGLSSNYIYGITSDRNNNIWIRTDDGLNIIDSIRKTFTFLNITFDRIHQSCPLSIDNNNQLWVCSSDGVLKINTITKKAELVFPLSNIEVKNPGFHFILPYNDNEIWLTASNGLYRVNLANKSSIRITNNIFNDSILTINKSNDGVFWFGCNKGLIKLNTNTKKFALYQHDENDPNTIKGSTIRAIFVDSDNDIWIGSTDGDCTERINRTTKKITRYYYTPGNPNSIASNTTTCFCEDKEGNLWIGSGNRGISILKKGEKSKFETIGHIESFNNSLRNNWVQDIYMDKYGIVWIGNETGLDLYNPKTKQFRHIISVPNDITTIAPYAVQSNCIVEDVRGNFWVGTFGGLTLMIPKDRNISAFQTEYKFIRFPINRMISMCYDPKNPDVIYAGALLNKLYKISINKQNPEKSEIETYSINKELPQSAIYGILSDAKGNLWISTDWGLFCFDTKTKSSKSFLVDDGLQDNRFFWGAYYKKPDGEMFFGGLNGVNSFYPQEIKDDSITPDVVFTNLRLFNKPVKVGQKINGRVALQENISYTKFIKLSHSDKVFSIEFSGLKYALPEKVKYKYMLEGFDNEWLFCDYTNRIVTYTNLKPGRYYFKVKAANYDGIWNKEGRSLEIIILPPWWDSWWAISFYIFIFLAALVLFYYYQFLSFRAKHQSEIKKVEKEKKEEINQFRLNFFTNISHEFRTPLTLIDGPLEEIIQSNYQMKVTEKYVPVIKRNTKILLDLVNEIMDFRKLETGKMLLAAEKTDIIEFITGYAKSFDAIAKKKKINFRIEFESNLPEIYVDKEAFRKILYNLLSNAFKFTNEEGFISLSVCKTPSKTATHLKNHYSIITGNKALEEFIEINIEDNGIGIAEKHIENIFDSFNQSAANNIKHQGSGLGLAITRQLVQLHKGDLFVQSTPGTGTCFTIHLPLGKLHLQPNQIVDSNTRILSNSNELIIEDVRNEKVADITYEDPHEFALNKSIKPLLLIVEDNNDLRNFIKEGLQEYYSLIEATNGNEGFEKAKKTNPNLIISDVMMPEMDGKELCHKLKNDIQTSHIPFILLTVLSSAQSISEGYKVGADLYIPKPFELNLLKIQIKNLLDNRNKVINQFKNANKPNITDLAIGNIDKDLLYKIEQLIKKHLSDQHFNVDMLSREIGLGRKTLEKKLKFLTGFTPGEYIDSIRLAHALELLKNTQLTSSEIAFRTGFSSSSYFAHCFRKKFKMSPKDYFKTHLNANNKGNLT